MKNYRIENDTIIIDSNGELFEVINPTPEILGYVLDSECTCSLVVVMDIQSILIGGQDDCPKHGFKKGEGLVEDTDSIDL